MTQKKLKNKPSLNYNTYCRGVDPGLFLSKGYTVSMPHLAQHAFRIAFCPISVLIDFYHITGNFI
jgi:hypothetical protein